MIALGSKPLLSIYYCIKCLYFEDGALTGASFFGDSLVLNF